MPRISSIELMNRTAQPTLVIRTHTGVENLARTVGESYGKQGAYLAELGELPAEIPFIAYYNMDMQNLDVEIGMPVAAPLSPRGDMVAGTIAAGLAISCMYQGPYHDMGPTYAEMEQWLQEQGYQVAGPVYEMYYNDPSFAENLLLTRIIMPVRKA